MAGTLVPDTPPSSSLIVPQFQYLGAYAAAPTARSNGSSLQTGDFYLDTTVKSMLAYDGAAWVNASVAATAATSAAAALASEIASAANAAAALVSENNAAASAASINPSALVPQTSSTGSAIMPSGTTAQRDGAPVAGYTRWNSTDGQLEHWDGTAWSPLGGGGGGGYTWLVKIAAYNIADGEGVLADSSAGGFDINLPAAGTVNQKVMIFDGATAGSWATNNVNVVPNGTDKIDGVNANYVLDVNFGWIELIDNGTEWIVRTDFASSSAQTVTDRTGVTTAKAMAIGEKWKIDVTAAASVPLYCTTATGQRYRLSFVSTNTVATTTGNLALQANDTTYASAIKRRSLHSNGSTVVTVVNLGGSFTCAYGSARGSFDAEITTATNGKSCKATMNMGSSTTNYVGIIGCYWIDNTTLWTSLGTIVTTTSETLDGTVFLERIQ